jgi:serine/threonine-protein kinase
MAFECLTGMRPFNQASLGSQVLAICAWPLPVPSHVAEVPIGFDAWFAKACCRPPSGRFSSIQAAASELSEVCQTPARQSSRPELTGTRPGAGPSAIASPRSDSLRTVAPASSLPPRRGLSKLSQQTTLLAASAVLLLLISTLFMWRLTRSTPDEADSTAKATPSTAVPQPKPAPVESAKPTINEGSGAAVETSVPMAPTPESRPTQLRASPRAAKAPPAKLAPKRTTRGLVEMKEDPY